MNTCILKNILFWSAAVISVIFSLPAKAAAEEPEIELKLYRGHYLSLIHI